MKAQKRAAAEQAFAEWNAALDAGAYCAPQVVSASSDAAGADAARPSLRKRPASAKLKGRREWVSVADEQAAQADASKAQE